MKKIAGLLFALSCFTSVFSQSISELESLKKKAYASYDSGDYVTSLSYLEKLIQLSENTGSALGADIYYDIACSYSLNKKAAQGLRFLQRSFEISNATKKANPVPASHISMDPDLDHVRKQPEFLALVKRYYSGSEYELIALMSTKEISYADFLKLIDLLSRQASFYTLRITDKMIYWKKSGDSLLFNEESLPMPNFEAFRGKHAEFVRCTFNLNFVWDGRSNKICDQMVFKECHFAGRFMFYELKFRNPPQFISCAFDKSLLIFSHSELIEGGPSQAFMLEKCELHYVQVRLLVESAVDVIITGNNARGDSAKISVVCDDVLTSVIQNNSLANNDFEIRFENVETLTISENKFRNLMIMSTNVASEFSLQNIDVAGKIFFNRTYFSSDPANDIQWAALKNNKIALSLDRFTGKSDFSPSGLVIFKAFPIKFISGEKGEDISNDQYFSKLMGLYSMFLNLYKSKNDIESYNACFVQIKEFQSTRLKYLYESNPSFERYFRWRLSQLLKFYVRYGTDPARAIVISIYIIVCFGIFFFFFPSDWDVTSKKRLITNFKDFIQKNEKGYVKPFFVLVGGYIVSLINAVTLSLNAFITLGFGNIPTHGIARYFCVLEGFLGWFLLSIFTVAMINQVL